MAELKITAANFENEVLHSDKPVLLDFYADWCGPCKMLSPILHELAEEKSGTLKVGKVNVDGQMELAMRFQVTSGVFCYAKRSTEQTIYARIQETGRGNYAAGETELSRNGSTV